MSTKLEPMVNIVFHLFAPQPQQYSITNIFGNMGGGGGDSLSGTKISRYWNKFFKYGKQAIVINKTTLLIVIEEKKCLFFLTPIHM